MRRFHHAALLTACLGLAAPSLAGDFPLTLANCGHELTLAGPPGRVVAVKSTAAELLLALGLQDRLAGVAFLDAPLPPEAAGVPVLAERMPAMEVVLEAAPELVYGGWESVFAGDAAGERATLAALGVQSYVAPAACRSVPPPPLGFDGLFAEILELGRIMGASPAAEALVAAQRGALAGVAQDGRGLTALWYSSGTRTPYVGAGSNAPQMILAALGLENIFGAVDAGWTQASWEAVAEADPDVIVLVDALWNSAAQKRALLAENPVTARLSAVIHGRYLVIAFPASEAGVRNVPATVDLAAQLAGLDIAP